MILLGIVHAIDYYRRASIEAIYVMIPFGKEYVNWIMALDNERLFPGLSLFIAILMTCIYSMGSTFTTSIVIAVVVRQLLQFVIFISRNLADQAWLATALYVYAAVKDYGDGKYYRVNDFHKQSLEPPPSETQRFDLSQDNEELTNLLLKD